MIELEALSAEIREQVGPVNGWDVVFAAPLATTADGVRVLSDRVRFAVEGLAPGHRAVLVHPNGAIAAPGEDGPALLSLPIASLDPLHEPALDAGDTYQMLFQVCGLTGARACVLLASDPVTLPPEAIRHLVQPVLEGRVDLVTPCYRPRRFEGLLRSSIVRPLVRALYGRRIQFPLAADFALSARLAERDLPLTRGAIPVWLVSDALCAGWEVGQAQLGAPLPVRSESVEVSVLVARVLGALFVEVERNAACWQRVRGSRPVPTFGPAPPLPAEGAGAVEVGRMVETFQLGFRSLQDVWSAVLPPATLVELKRLSTLEPARFRLLDTVWARIVYDFALAHRMRIMNRDHLLKAMTPLYLAWVASFATEVGRAAAVAVEYRLERLGAAYEAEKPYFVSRWRWPDRFQP